MIHIVEYKRTEIVHLEIDLPDDTEDGGFVSQMMAKGIVVDGRAPQGMEYKRTVSDWERCHYERKSS